MGRIQDVLGASAVGVATAGLKAQPPGAFRLGTEGRRTHQVPLGCGLLRETAQTAYGDPGRPVKPFG